MKIYTQTHKSFNDSPKHLTQQLSPSISISKYLPKTAMPEKITNEKKAYIAWQKQSSRAFIAKLVPNTSLNVFSFLAFKSATPFS